MCLTRPSEKKIASTNILCWKTLNRWGKSAIRDYEYEIGVTQPLVELTLRHGEVEQGYHSWVDQARTDRYGYSGTKVYHLFVIPKGTTYYEGLENGGAKGYVSETIVYLGHNKNPFTWLRKLKYTSK
jgi:hypothetical protein